jgi:hypothetical protein
VTDSRTIDRPLQLKGENAPSDDGLPSTEWRRALIQLADDLSQPMPLRETERIEDVLKTYLRRIFRQRLSLDDARFLAEWQRDLGFVLKYKSYGVKCATPVGYSIFLQNPGEGFSFQRHVTHKTEIFHILEPLEQALVFLCSSADWEAAYDHDRFRRWLDGSPDIEFDRFATRPRSGDVYHVSELGLVHSVLGCVLEEFATVSTDMVDRLHDQNAGREEPRVPRDAIVARLRNLRVCVPRIPATDPATTDVVAHVGELESYRLASGAIDATRLHMRRACVELRAQASRLRLLVVVGGSASVVIRGTGDVPTVTSPPIHVRRGDPLLLVPGFEIVISAVEDAVISIHGIEPEVSLV